MASRKHKKPLCQFESLIPEKDTTALIAHSMQISPAWIDLTPQQKVLYCACKDQRYQQRAADKPVKVDKEYEKDVFAMNTRIFIDLYHLYSEGNKAGFYRDMAALINHGFIDCFHSGKETRSRNAYRFSPRWKTWKKGDIAPERMMTSAMREKYYPQVLT